MGVEVEYLRKKQIETGRHHKQSNSSNATNLGTTEGHLYKKAHKSVGPKQSNECIKMNSVMNVRPVVIFVAGAMFGSLLTRSFARCHHHLHQLRRCCSRGAETSFTKQPSMEFSGGEIRNVD
ncbi:unnamed protein product [Citrullus colocynthis]|uniref:Transmembrane protein n=1 Tax=Citrullus colocynthis TaxID=252529 RepID=A0ABP0Z7S9_9ROSI